MAYVEQGKDKYIKLSQALEVLDSCACWWAHERMKSIPAADVLPRDEAIKMGAELAAMHGATPEQQQLEEAYLKGVEDGMTRRNVRPVVRGKWTRIDYEPCGHDYKCSVCGWNNDMPTLYCPNCGAMMEES